MTPMLRGLMLLALMFAGVNTQATECIDKNTYLGTDADRVASDCAKEAMAATGTVMAEAATAQERGEVGAACAGLDSILSMLQPYLYGHWRDTGDYFETATLVQKKTDYTWDLLIKNECPEKITRYKKAAEEGKTWAQTSLAHSYAMGKGVPVNSTLAVEWYQRAIAQGDTGAMVALGLMYERGEGVVEDAAKAFALYMKAAKADSSTGQYNVASCYNRGFGVEEDFKQAVRWFKKAKDNGDEDAEEELEKMYRARDAKKSQPKK